MAEEIDPSLCGIAVVGNSSDVSSGELTQHECLFLTNSAARETAETRCIILHQSVSSQLCQIAVVVIAPKTATRHGRRRIDRCRAGAKCDTSISPMNGIIEVPSLKGVVLLAFLLFVEMIDPITGLCNSPLNYLILVPIVLSMDGAPPTLSDQFFNGPMNRDMSRYHYWQEFWVSLQVPWSLLLLFSSSSYCY